MRLFESRVVRETFGPKTGEVQGDGEDYTTRHAASVGERCLWDFGVET